jgi:Tfp pilus assembly protein FimT
MPKVSSEAGFSIVELLIVLLILVTVSAMAVPNFRAVEAAWALDSAGADVAGQLTNARLNALKRNRQTWLLVTVPTSTVQVQTFDEDGNVAAVGIPSLLPRTVGVVTGGNASTQRIRFDSMGRPVDAVGVIAEQNIQLRHARTQRLRNVVVTTTGRITVN